MTPKTISLHDDARSVVCHARYGSRIRLQKGDGHVSDDSTATTQAAVATYLDGLNSLDADLALSRFSADVVVHYPGKPSMSKDAFHASLAEVFAALKSMDFTTREVFETDHGVAARWTFVAETRGGQTATCDGIDSWRIGAEGTVSAIDVYYDPSPLAQALAD